MTAIINTAAIIVAAALISEKTKRPMVTAIPTVWCMLMLILQVLSCFHALSLIDGLSLVFIVCCGIWFAVKHPHKGLKRISGSALMHPSVVVFLLVMFGVVLLNRNAMVTDIDDINYWGISVRALFERNGLEGKYYTVSAGWGDYPLGQQLIEWWFIHTFSGEWQESLLFIGYYVLLFSFVVPYFSSVTNKPGSVIGASVVCFLVTLVHVNLGSIHKLNADLLMAVMYGSCISYILQILDNDAAELNRMDVLSVSIQLAGITMIKSIGIFWSASAAILYYLLRAQQLKNQDSDSPWFRRLRWYDHSLLLPTISIYVLWRIVCIVLSRETYLVESLLTAQVISAERHLEQFTAFLYAVFFEPTSRFWKIKANIGFSLAFIIFLPMLFFLYIRKNREQRKPIFQTVVLFTIGVTVGYLLILLYSFETMFINEIPAVPAQMMDALVRYLMPCIVLVRAVLWHTYAAWPRKTLEKRYGAIIMGAILLCSLNTIHLMDEVSGALQKNEKYMQKWDEYEDQFAESLDQLDQLDDRLNASVYYFCEDVADNDFAHFAYLAGGTAVEVSSYMNPEDVSWCLANAHVTHTVICSNGDYTEEDYQELMADGTQFEFGKLYNVVNFGDEWSLLQEMAH